MSREKEDQQKKSSHPEESEKNKYRRAYLKEKIDSIESSRQSIDESYEAIMGEPPDFDKKGVESDRENLRQLIDSPPPDKVRNVDLKKEYNDLYTETQDILTLLNEIQDKSEKWRIKTWIWRLFSFLLMILLSRDLIMSAL